MQGDTKRLNPESASQILWSSSVARRRTIWMIKYYDGGDLVRFPWQYSGIVMLLRWRPGLMLRGVTYAQPSMACANWRDCSCG